MTRRSKVVEVTVYGAQKLCPSCLNLPSSEETADWLEAALTRDYGDGVRVRYVDIDQPHNRHNQFVEAILADRYAYPLIVIGEEVVGEGNPRLNVIRRKLEEMGLERHV